jgi:hypothetical protein
MMEMPKRRRDPDRASGTVTDVSRHELDDVDPDAVHDDAEDIDHVARLADPAVLADVVELDRDIEDDAARR